jgi:hypothetical protein
MKSSIPKLSIVLLLLFMACTGLAQNQNKLFADFGAGSYSTYKMEFSFDYNNVKKYKFEKVSKQWPVYIQQGSGKDFDGNSVVEIVTISRQGVIKENFTPDIAENPVYFGYKDFRITAIGNKVYQYEWSNDNANIIYILSKGDVSGYETEKSTLENFVRAAFKNQLAARGKLNEVKAANAQKAAAENTLKGKTVKAIEIEMLDVPKEMGLRSTVKFGIKATTTDGKTYSTPNIGGKTPWDDFAIKTTDGLFVDEAIEVHEDASKVNNDELKFTVSSKYTPAVTAQKVISLNYEVSKFNIVHKGRAGWEWMRDVGGVMQALNGESAKSLELKIQKATTKNTNLPIFKIEVIETKAGKVISRLKVSQNTVINIDVTGGTGDKGADRKDRKGDDGKDGGSGGDVVVSKAADVSNINLNLLTNGGKGGKGGNGSTAYASGSPGKDGRDGKITNKVLAGNLAW